jgi:hypothetical protein
MARGGWNVTCDVLPLALSVVSLPRRVALAAVPLT